MKRVAKITAIAIAVIFVGIQFVRPDRTNPPVVPGKSIESQITVPGDVSEILGRSCNDCHSHKTVYPWYSHVAPASWFLGYHVNHGREHMNMSEWVALSREKQARMLEEICEMVRGDEMPLPSYLWIHHDAVLSAADKDALCTWTEIEKTKLESALRTEAK